jgi:hypothetical protein
VTDTGRDKQLLAWFRTINPAANLELDLAFQYGYELIDGMHEVFPSLARRVRPEITSESAFAPVLPDGFLLGGRYLSVVFWCHARTRLEGKGA